MEKAAEGSMSGGGGARPGLSRRVYAILGLALLAGSTLIGLMQGPRPDPSAAFPVASLSWWRHPLESDALLRLAAHTAPVRAVHLLPKGKQAWAVGDGGLILRSDDGGLTWTQQGIGRQTTPAPDLKPVKAANSGFVRAAWAAQAPVQDMAPVDNMAPVQQAVPQTATKDLAAQKADLLAKEAPAPAVKTPPKVPVRRPPQEKAAPAKPSPQPAAPSPSPTAPPIPPSGPYSGRLSGVWFLDAQRGFVVGEDGALFASEDGGMTWRGQTVLPGKMLGMVFSGDGKLGAVWNDLGRLIFAEASGQDWGRQVRNYFDLRLRSVALTPAGEWLVFGDGRFDHPPALGPVDLSPPLHSVAFLPDGSQGWAVSRDGALFRSKDGGKRWLPVWQAVDRHTLDSVRFAADGETGLAVSRAGIILASGDGGRSWSPRTRLAAADAAPAGEYRRYPAPWVYAAWLLGFGLLLTGLRRPPPRGKEEISVADMLASDRPLEPGDPDALDLRSIALALSRFLRNEHTRPPLTIAVTGEWGSGKSSLMNLLKGDLQRFGVRPVWFNAWHHQKEEHLLASLLAAIRGQAVPPLFTPEGLLFRGRLLLIRSRDNLPWVFTLLLLVSASLSYFLAHPGQLEQALATLGAVSALWQGGEIESGQASDPLAPLAALLGPSFLVLLGLLKGLRAFGMNPAVLLAAVGEGASIRQAKAQTGFRHAFAQEFRQVTQALKPRIMLILIDDLDRCRPDAVLEVLEAVNFLVSSGDCYVVLGMAPERVLRCVGLGFKDVAAEMEAAPEGEAGADGEAGEDDGRRRRREFARHYLEKLVNIEVPVPEASPEQSERLLTALPGTEAPIHRLEAYWRQVRPWAQALILAGAALWAGQWLGTGLSGEVPVQQPAVPQAAGETAPTGTPQAEPGPIRAEAPSTTAPAHLLPAAADGMRLGVGGIPAALLVLAGLGWLLARRDPVVRDSPEFTEALRIWHPLVIARQNTPRAVKRFLNRVRYFAMRIRRQEETPALWQRLLRRGTALMPPGGGMDEPSLVALAAIHHVDPGRMETFPIEGPWEGQPGQQEQNLRSALQTAQEEHRKRFGAWPPTPEQIVLFRELAKGIHVT